VPDHGAVVCASYDYLNDFRVFFFSSRRRHTRFSRDWSSDVCSSDLEEDREAHGAEEETVDGSVACRGTEPDEGRVQREVLVLYRSEERRVGKEGGARRPAGR